MLFGEKTMNKLSRLYMTGILRTYLIYMFGAIVVIVLATLFAKDAFTFNVSNLSPVNGYGLLTAVILTISVCMLIFAKKRRSEEHTSELQSRGHLVCRLLLEKKNSKARRQ